MFGLYFFGALIFSTVLGLGVQWLMRAMDVVDRPKANARKIHKKTIPLGGGLVIFIVFFALACWAMFVSGVIGEDVTARHLIGILIGSLVLMIGGLLDDKYNLRATQQIWFPVIATLVVIGFGIGPHQITNPLGGIISLDALQISVGTLGTWVVLADIVVFFWLMGMMFTTKFLDGLDGLVAGVTAIGALVIFFLSTRTAWVQPDVALLAVILGGACLGFLFWNWHPAKIFLGEGGSLLTGFLLGSLAIISGSKIATTLLVVGIPMLDVGRVIIRRIARGQRFYEGDNEHLHFKLLRSGLSHRQAVLLFYAIAFLFGMTTLFLQSSQKVIALSFLFVLMLLIGLWVSRNDTNRSAKNE